MKSILSPLLFMGFMLLLFSCMTSKKAIDHLEKTGELSGYCAVKYPPSVEYVPGTVSIYHDTTFIPGDSIPCPNEAIEQMPSGDGPGELIAPPQTGRIRYVKCPPTMIIRDSSYRKDTGYVTSTAAVDALQRQINKVSASEIALNNYLVDEIANKKWWKSAALITWVVMGVCTLFFCILFYVGNRKTII